MLKCMTQIVINHEVVIEAGIDRGRQEHKLVCRKDYCEELSHQHCGTSYG